MHLRFFKPRLIMHIFCDIIVKTAVQALCISVIEKTLSQGSLFIIEGPCLN